MKRLLTRIAVVTATLGVAASDGRTYEIKLIMAGRAASTGCELTFRRRNGERFHVLLQGKPLFDDRGQVSRAPCTVRARPA